VLAQGLGQSLKQALTEHGWVLAQPLLAHWALAWAALDWVQGLMQWVALLAE
jgi:hypothetical protein